MRLHLPSTNKSLLLLSLIAVVALTFSQALFVQAAPITDFNAGNIIDDGVFYNKNAMSVQQIQSFINNLTPNCYPYGQNPAYGFNPPYVCLKDYHENPTTGETSFEKGGGWFAGSMPAAQIIYNAAQQYSINPQVLLVMLKKESAGPLTADTWPVKNQYKYAMGYACPDSGPGNSAQCDESRAGFYKQVMLAAWQLNYYREHVNDYRYALGWNDIQYSPDVSCGTKRVYIENVATLSLYIYTPYTPNDGALANYPGQAPCGAYGNRNFYMFFREWFGGVRGDGFKMMDDPRFMRVRSSATYKRYVYTGSAVGGELSVGQQIRFADKIDINGKWYLRTEYDKQAGNIQGIPLDELEDIPFEDLPSPVWMTLVNGGNKSYPRSRGYVAPITAGTSIKFTQKMLVDGATYFRTEYDALNENYQGINASQLDDFQFIRLDVPTYMHTNQVTDKIDLVTGSIQETFPEDTSVRIEGKTLVNGVWYFQELDDYNNKKSLSINSSYLSASKKNPLSRNVTIKLPSPTYKKDLHTLSNAIDSPLPAGQSIVVSHSMVVNNELYFMTKYDDLHGNYQGIKVSDLFIGLEVPKNFVVKNSTNKIDLSTISPGSALTKGQEIFFSTKLSLDNEWCLRSQHDTGINNLLCVPLQYVE